MGARQLTRRKAYTVGIPKSVAIPKFLRPAEILTVKEMKKDRPDLEWEEVIELVVLDSAPCPLPI